MSKQPNRTVTPRTTNSKSNSNRSSNRPNPNISKAGVTRSGRKSYGCGGKVK